MVATIAHEIRNPLGIVRSSAEVLAKKTNPDPSKIQKLSRIIVEEATRLSSILTDFLDFARPRSPNPKAIDVRDVIARVKNNLEEEIQARRIQWLDQQLNGFHPIIMGDADLLYQAFLNVAMNSFEAMKDGGTLIISVSQEGSKIRVDFADDGHGIREDDLPKIFTPFFTTHQMGTGLGLSVVHNIIIAHGGDVSVQSREGQGAEFTISLPAEDQPVGGVPR